MPNLLKKTYELYHSEKWDIRFYPLGLNKFLLPVFGFLFFSVPGIWVGLFFGLLLDVKFNEALIPPQPGDLGITFMMLAVAVMRAGGSINQKSLRYAYLYVMKNFGKDYLNARLQVFDSISKQRIPLDDICIQLSYHLDYPVKMQLIFFLVGLGSADGVLAGKEATLILEISNKIGLQAKDFNSIRAMFISSEPGSAYLILEIDPSASKREVKRAYYKLAKKHHPDKLAHLGKAYQKAAREKFEIIKGAYEKIKRERGIN
jgi:DnaJ like chaperone protein